MKSHVALALIIGLLGCNTGEHTKPKEQLDSASISSSSERVEPLRIQDSLLLRYTPRSGTELHCWLVQSEAFDQDSLHIRARTEWFYTQVVDTLQSDGQIILNMHYDSIRLEQRYWQTDSSAVQTVRYNSTHQPDRQDERFSLFTAALGKNIRVVLTPLGGIESITGTGEIVHTLLGARLDSLTKEQRHRIEQQFAAELYAPVLAQQFLLLPEKPLDSTRTWSRAIPQDISPLFVAHATAVYRLDSLKRRGNDSLLLVSASLGGTIRLAPAAESAGIILRKGTVRGRSDGELSTRYALPVRRWNTIDYAIAAEVRKPGTSGERLTQVRHSESTFRLRSLIVR